MATDKLIIFDTSLRDGEQSPGVMLNADEKVEIAKQLSLLGVDVLEAGFPIASNGDFKAVQRIAREVGTSMEGREKIGKEMTICGLARSVKADIERCAEAIQDAPRKRIHLFLATSDLHLKYKLKIDRDECVKRAVEAVTLARSLVDDVEFSPEDAGRSDRDFLCLVLGKVIEAGATTLNIPDTVGYNTPEEYGDLIKYLVANTPGADKVTFSTHCHNDLGLATANTLAGIQNGARQVEVTINGIGERAGNTSLEEVVMAVHTHPNFYPVHHTINTKLIYSTSQMVSSMSGMMVQPNKAIVGRNAFLHASGIHQDGILKNRQTYEIITPETVGVTGDTLQLGKLSGRNAFRERCIALGFASLSTEKLHAAFESFKSLCDQQKDVSDTDILAILNAQESGTAASKDYFKLVSVEVVSHTSVATSQSTGADLAKAKATIRLLDVQKGTELTGEKQSVSGPIGAIFDAIQAAVGREFILTRFNINAVGEGSDAVGKAEIQIKHELPDAKEDTPNYIFNASVADSDITTAATKAYLTAINKLMVWEADATKNSNASISPIMEAGV